MIKNIGILVLSVVLVVSHEGPDWSAISQKYEEIEASWQDFTEKAMEYVQKDIEVDHETIWPAEQLLYSFLNKVKALYESTVHKGVEERSLTTTQVLEYHDKSTQLSDQDNKQFKELVHKLRKETMTNLEVLYDDYRKYVSGKAEDIVKLLNS